MPIPPFTIDRVLPPFIGAHGPGGPMSDMSPYHVSAAEVATTLGTTAQRIAILEGWLNHRSALRAAGFTRGFQWLDGSFVEDKIPQDLDVVSFLHRPRNCGNNDLVQLMVANPNVFDRPSVKATHKLDVLFVDLQANPETVVSHTRYWFGLFSHRRTDHIWKGMLQVRIEDVADDTAAKAILAAQLVAVQAAAAAAQVGAAPGANP